MQCEQCQQNQATVHVTHIENGEKIEQHLCENCAKKMQTFNFGDSNLISFDDFFTGLLNMATGASAYPQSLGNKNKSYATHGVQCPSCKMTYDEFKKTGKLGCATCYQVFEHHLYPVIKRIHGNINHTGKLPQRAATDLKVKRKIKQLNEELQRAIEEEAYEKAAQIRDQIRALEKEEL